MIGPEVVRKLLLLRRVTSHLSIALNPSEQFCPEMQGQVTEWSLAPGW
jgi:hypothetical protein